MARKTSSRNYVVCVNNRDYPASLEVRKLYRVLRDEKASRVGMIRVIDESGEDYLYPSNCFLAVNLPQAVESALRAS